jgi:hypothetical protein
MLHLIRFFRVVPPVPSLMVGTFVVVTTASIAAVCIDRSLAPGMLKAVLVLQLFAVSSGFIPHARRGHYDLLLTRGDDRLAIALVHWVMSAAPGIASWLTVTTSEVLAAGGHTTVGLTSGSIAAAFVVSTAPWAFTTPLPRFAGAIGWLAVFTLGAAVQRSVPIAVPIVNLVYPVGMIGEDLWLRSGAAVLPLAVALASMASALVWIRRVSIPLEAAQ